MRARREELKCRCGEWIWLEEVHSDFCRMCHSVEHLCAFCNAFEPFTNRDGLCPECVSAIGQEIPGSGVELR